MQPAQQQPEMHRHAIMPAIIPGAAMMIEMDSVELWGVKFGSLAHI